MRGAGAGGARRKTKARLTPVEELEAYFESPEPLTTLVFVAGALDANRRLVKLLRKHARSPSTAARWQSAADAAEWIKARLERTS